MRIVIAFAALAASLSGCQTASSQTSAIYAYSGEGEARYEGERQSAQALIDSNQFSTRCVGDDRYYRVDRAETLFGDCSRHSYPPVLVRQKVLSNEEAILLVMNSQLGVVGEGTLLLHDGRRMIPIAVDNLESFGDVLARDRIVIHGGTIDGSACGMTLWSKELTLDWANGRISRERDIPRAQPRCES